MLGRQWEIDGQMVGERERIKEETLSVHNVPFFYLKYYKMNFL